MKKIILTLSLVGCTNVYIPTPGWQLNSEHQSSDTVCFRQPHYSNRWMVCAIDANPSDRNKCLMNIILSTDGEIFHNTKVSVYSHNSNGESKVLIEEGEHKGEVFFCPTVRVWKL